VFANLKYTIHSSVLKMVFGRCAYFLLECMLVAVAGLLVVLNAVEWFNLNLFEMPWYCCGM
jgi:hypothetical protein